jgi:hypothetical protein
MLPNLERLFFSMACTPRILPNIASSNEGGEVSYGSRRLDRACLNHLRNISSVSIISVKPALLIFTVETIEGGPG